MNFDEWYRRVVDEMENKWGVHPDDLPDWCYRDAYDKGMKATTVARLAYKYAEEEL